MFPFSLKKMQFYIVWVIHLQKEKQKKKLHEE